VEHLAALLERRGDLAGEQVRECLRGFGQ
jgi:hypothetical protein